MIVGACTVENLSNWFHNQQNEYQFLVLYACKRKSDCNLISNLISEYLEIDLITKTNVLVFLFYDGQSEIANFQTGPHRLFLPALIPAKDKFPFQTDLSQRNQELFDWNFKLTGSSRISDLTLSSDIMTDLRRASERFSEQIIDFYGISAVKLPAVICLSRENEVPILASTFHSDYSKPFLSFLQELADIASARRLGIQTDQRPAKLRKALENVTASVSSIAPLEQTKNRHQRYLEKLSDRLDEAEIPSDIVSHTVSKLKLEEIGNRNIDTRLQVTEIGSVRAFEPAINALFADRQFDNLLRSIEKNAARFVHYGSVSLANPQEQELARTSQRHCNDVEREIRWLKGIEKRGASLQARYGRAAYFAIAEGFLVRAAALLSKARQIRSDLEDVARDFDNSSSRGD